MVKPSPKFLTSEEKAITTTTTAFSVQENSPSTSIWSFANLELLWFQRLCCSLCTLYTVQRLLIFSGYILDAEGLAIHKYVPPASGTCCSWTIRTATFPTPLALISVETPMEFALKLTKRLNVAQGCFVSLRDICSRWRLLGAINSTCHQTACVAESSNHSKWPVQFMLLKSYDVVWSMICSCQLMKLVKHGCALWL